MASRIGVRIIFIAGLVLSNVQHDDDQPTWSISSLDHDENPLTGWYLVWIIMMISTPIGVSSGADHDNLIICLYGSLWSGSCL